MNNPHAFPIVGQWGVTEQGMTLRDYFAGKAMQSLIVTRNGVIGTNKYEYLVTEDSYKIADAMLKAREA